MFSCYIHLYLYTIECSSVRPDAALCITFTHMFTCTHVCTRMFTPHIHAHACVHLHARLHTHVHDTRYACVHSHMYIYVCLLKPGFWNLAPPLPSLGPKHSSECMVQMVFNLFFGLFASLDRLSVPTAEGPLPLQKYEPMWKHSGGKLMGPIPLTQNSTARFSFDFLWFVFLICLCI